MQYSSLNSTYRDKLNLKLRYGKIINELTSYLIKKCILLKNGILKLKGNLLKSNLTLINQAAFYI